MQNNVVTLGLDAKVCYNTLGIQKNIATLGM